MVMDEVSSFLRSLPEIPVDLSTRTMSFKGFFFSGGERTEHPHKWDHKKVDFESRDTFSTSVYFIGSALEPHMPVRLRTSVLESFDAMRFGCTVVVCCRRRHRLWEYE